MQSALAFVGVVLTLYYAHIVREMLRVSAMKRRMIEVAGNKVQPKLRVVGR